MLENAAANETNTNAKFALDTLIKNDKLALQNNMPACQDTGIAVVFADVGQDVRLTGEFLDDAINRAVQEVYAENFFRKSVADPLTRLNTKTNTPAVIYSNIVKGDKVTVSFLAKGFGSENMSKVFMLTPSQGIDGIKKAVLDTVKAAGANPCPPIFVGVGVGGTMEKAAMLSKRALLRGGGELSTDKDIAKLERELLKLINETGIGAQGFGGKHTALCVAVETFPTHIAGLPVAVNIQCHAVRHSTVVI
jgi:fumarate hydratase subunit alpha